MLALRELLHHPLMLLPEPELGLIQHTEADGKYAAKTSDSCRLPAHGSSMKTIIDEDDDEDGAVMTTAQTDPGDKHKSLSQFTTI